MTTWVLGAGERSSPFLPLLEFNCANGRSVNATGCQEEKKNITVYMYIHKLPSFHQFVVSLFRPTKARLSAV